MIEIEEDITLGYEVKADFFIYDSSSLYSYHHDIPPKRISMGVCDFPWETHVSLALDITRRKKMFEESEDTMELRGLYENHAMPPSGFSWHIQRRQ